MTTILFQNGKPTQIQGSGKVNYHDHGNFYSLQLWNDNFNLIGDVAAASLSIINGSLDAISARFTDHYFSLRLTHSSAANVKADRIVLVGDSTLSDSATNALEIDIGTLKGKVAAESLSFGSIEFVNLTLAKNAVLELPNIALLSPADWNHLKGEGKIYIPKEHALYDIKQNKTTYLELENLKDGEHSAAFSLDDEILSLNKGYDFTILGDKNLSIVNGGNILNADITGPGLKSIVGTGAIKALHLSKGANLAIGANVDINDAKISLEANTLLSLSKNITFDKKISGEGYIKINGKIYDTSGQTLENNDTKANIIKYNSAIAGAIENKKEQKFYSNEEQNDKELDLLSMSGQSEQNDNLLWIL